MNISRCFTTGLAVASIYISGNALAGTAVHSGKSDIMVQPVVMVEGEAEVWLHGGIESWAGDITYQIGYPATLADGTKENGYFPFSELKFPLDCVFGAIEMNAVFHDRVILNGTIKKNVSDPDSNMEDRDWITETNPKQLDVYSESFVSDFSALIIDVDLEYKFLQLSNAWVAGGIGFLYQNFQYNTSLIRQWSPSGISDFDYTGDGISTSIDYEATFRIPYLVISSQMSPTKKFHINGRLAYAPIAYGDDRDQHILRDKENKGDLDGSAFMLSVSALFDFTPRWFMSAGVDLTAIEMSGDMDATFYGVYDHTVTEELDSTQASVFITTGYRFGPESHENMDKIK